MKEEGAKESRSGRIMLGGAEVGPFALFAARRSRSSMKLPLAELRERLRRLFLFGLRRLLFGDVSAESVRLTAESSPFSLLRVMPGVVGVVGISTSVPSETILL